MSTNKRKMKINWFGRKYYKSSGGTFERNMFVAFKCWLELDLFGFISHERYYHENGELKRKYDWLHKRIYRKLNPFIVIRKRKLYREALERYKNGESLQKLEREFLKRR